MLSNFLTRATLLIVLLGAVVSCGVESEVDPNQTPDSDPQVQVFRGRTLHADGSAYSGVSASFPFNGNTDISDSAGQFEIFSSVVSGDIPLKLLTPEGLSFEVALSSVPDTAREISFDLNFPSTSAAPSVDNLTIVTSATPSDSPTPEETPDSNPPTDEPSDPGSGDGSSPTPTKTPKASPSPTPSGPSDKEKLIARGKKVHSSTCGKCHGSNQGRGKSGSALKKTLKLPQHKSVKVGGSDFDALVAYLNR